MKKYWYILLLAVITGFGLVILTVQITRAQVPSPTQAATITVTDDQVNLIAKKLYCPVCPNTPLDVCETKACQDWRAQIRQELGDGWSEQQIMDYFVQQYGERVLGEPERKGFTSMVWVLPLVGVVLGTGVVWQVLRSWKKTRSGANSAPPPNLADLPDEQLALVEKELKKLD